MESIIITNVVFDGKRVEVTYNVSLGLKRFFNESQPVFWTEYDEIITSVPIAIAIIPFVCNVLPIVWLTNATLELPEIDKSFYESISEFKKGYVQMYPMFEFNGRIITTKVVDCGFSIDGGNAAFFSGGVDAFTTLICHRDEHPLLLTVKGADVSLDDEVGWQKVSQHVQTVAGQFELPPPAFISSNFRSFISEESLSAFVADSKDGWWHGFQHGIGILSLVAPTAWLRHLKIIYIASSNTANEITTCASDPTIDNYLRFGRTIIVHDQYDLNRQQKIQTIVKYCKDTSQTIEPRVCWISKGGENCCHCEKCLRTMFGFMAENESPLNYGFVFSNDDLQNSKFIVTNAISTTNDTVRGNWTYIIKRFRETKAYKNDNRINWVYRFNPYAKKKHPIVFRWAFNIIKRVYHHITQIQSFTNYNN